MATAFPPTVESIFDVTAEQIRVAFDRIITEVRSRRDQLLSEIEDRRREFELKNSAMFESVRELEDMRIHLEIMSVKQNVAMKRQQESLASIDSEIVALRTDANRNTQLKYSCSLDQLIQQVKKFEEIIDKASTRILANSKYSRKQSTDRVLEGFGGSIKLHVDPYKELLYVTCAGINEVRVYNANYFNFVGNFDENNFDARCITASKEFVYFLSIGNSLYKYESSDLSLVRKVESSFFQIFASYIGIAVSEDNQLLVMDNCGTINLYDEALIFKEKIKLDLKRFKESNPIYCLSMVMRENNIFILLTSKILLFVPFGDWNNITCYFKKQKGKIPYVTDPSAFCIDSAGNVIVADAGTSSIKFLSPEGDLIHTIGESTVGSDSISCCSDIAVYKDSVIVACRDDDGFHIKMY